VATIGTPTSDQFERMLQLVNKTNQFNLNGIRRTLPELKKFVDDVDSMMLVAEFKDDLVNYGLTSVIGGRFVAQTFNVEIWVMSCRTFDRYLEHAVLSALRGKIIDKSNGDVNLNFKRTTRNEYFVATGIKMGLFAQDIDDGIRQVRGQRMLLPTEIPLQVVLRQ
jgi:FkbH-like protein